jgi:hypothetical protein
MSVVVVLLVLILLLLLAKSTHGSCLAFRPAPARATSKSERNNKSGLMSKFIGSFLGLFACQTQAFENSQIAPLATWKNQKADAMSNDIIYDSDRRPFSQL